MFPPNIDPEVRDAKIEELGLNDPWYIQLGIYLGNFLKGEWGESYLGKSAGYDVREWIFSMIPRTLTLTAIPVVIVPIIGVKFGVTSANHRNKPIDTLIRGFAVAGAAVPVFFSGLIFQLISGFYLKRFTGGEFYWPTFGYKNIIFQDPAGFNVTNFRILDSIIANDQDRLFDALTHVVLPIFTMTIVSLAGITRITRTTMLDVLQMDYIRTARAKGCPESTVINKHALRNAMIPTSTGIVLGFALAITNSMITEQVFNMYGMGQTYFYAIIYRDYWMITGCASTVAIAVLIGYLAADITYTIIDPRITY
jgi:peptide/nickel transport system permease protein